MAAVKKRRWRTTECEQREKGEGGEGEYAVSENVRGGDQVLLRTVLT